MRRNTSKKSAVAVAALAAAAWTAFYGTPAARADIIISYFNMGTQTYGGNTWQVWVAAATNNGLNGTGSGIDGVDATITTSGNPLAVDIEKVSGTGANTVYHANVDGQSNDANGVDAGGPPLFGDVVGGTFIGLGTGVFNTDIANHPIMTYAGANAGGVIVSGNPVAFANGHSAVTTGKLSTLDPAFQNAGSVNAGNINNGSVDTLEVIATEPDPGVDASSGPIPFANIVLPLNQTFSISGSIAPDSSGHGPVAFGPTVEPGLPEPTVFGFAAVAGAGLLKRRRRTF